MDFHALIPSLIVIAEHDAPDASCARHELLGTTRPTSCLVSKGRLKT
jgi:hypothetical protein